MKPLHSWKPLFFAILTAQLLLGTGCTSALWDKETFAHHYRPAIPADLHLFYSAERKDILVQYQESVDDDSKLQPRCYWLEPNLMRVNRDRKPRFVSDKAANGLTPLVLSQDSLATQPGPTELHAVLNPANGVFTLHSGNQQMERYKLPTYSGKSQKIKQVLLTPFAVVVDSTIIGAVIGYYAAPEVFTELSRP